MLVISLLVLAVVGTLAAAVLLLAIEQQRIAVARRDQAQAVLAARSLAALARTWFDDPGQGNPAAARDGELQLGLRAGRTFAPDGGDPDSVAAANGNAYGGGIDDGAPRLFERPWCGTPRATFWGERDTPDVLACSNSRRDATGSDADADDGCTQPAADLLQRLESYLAPDAALSQDGHAATRGLRVRFDEVRIHAPPLDRARGERHGIATLEAVASLQQRASQRSRARRRVVEVLGSVPPLASGAAVWSGAPLARADLSRVHWGALEIAAAGPVEVLRSQGAVPGPTVPRHDASRFGFHAALGGVFGSAATPGDPQHVTLLEELAGARHAEAAADRPIPVLADPWLLLATGGPLTVPGARASGGTQPWPWAPTDGVAGAGSLDARDPRAWSHVFQHQATRLQGVAAVDRALAATSRLRGHRRFAWRGGESYAEDDHGPERTWSDWVRAEESGPGVFLFGTTDGEAPAPDGANLTPPHVWPAGLHVLGALLLATSELDVSGAGAPQTTLASAPGEPFLDEGLDLADPASGLPDGCICLAVDLAGRCLAGTCLASSGCAVAGGSAPPGGCPCSSTQLALMASTASARLTATLEASTVRNGRWDADADGDGTPDADPVATSEAAGLLADGPCGDPLAHGVPRGCLPHPGTDPRFGAGSVRPHQPHEPFLNLASIQAAAAHLTWPDAAAGFIVDARAEGSLVKEETTSTSAARTTRARDARGPLVALEIHLDGFLQVEGSVAGGKALAALGAVLARGGYNDDAIPEVWFDEDLASATFPPRRLALPRVRSVSSEER